MKPHVALPFERERCQLLGYLALLAPLPLPFNQVLEWPILFLYSLAVVYFLRHLDGGQRIVLPTWSLNLLGLLYLPFFFVDIRLTFTRNSPVQALLHLILFLLVVKLYSLRREGETWHVLGAIFFVFIGAMATSSHVTIGLYLFFFLVASLFALARLAQLHAMARYDVGRYDVPTRTTEIPVANLPFRTPLALGTVLVILVTIPLFAIMPRFREPFVGGGSGLPGIGRTTGFSDSVDLSLTTSIRGNRNVVARIQYEEFVGDPSDLRFKGATFDLYRNRRWFRLAHRTLRLQPTEDQVFHLTSKAIRNTLGPLRTADMYLEPIGSSSLILPSQAASLRLDLFPLIELDPGGAVQLPVRSRRDTLRYQVHLADAPQIAARRSPSPDSEISGLDIRDLKPRIAELAAQVMGGRTPEEQVDRLEQFLLTEYAYTTDLLGRDGENPLEEFLFTEKSGHCELFATSMVLMLRSQGIPARYVTGFLSAEYNPLEDYFIIRQQNAHAWVEAFTPERGWRVYDPTPPEGRPGVADRGLRLMLSQIVDFITFRWDRYVLTYGADDQESFFQGVKEFFSRGWNDLMGRFGDDGPESLESTSLGLEEESGQSTGIWRPAPLATFLTLLAILGGWLAWYRHHAWNGAGAYLRLRRALETAGLEVRDTTPPHQLAERAAAHFPEAAEAVGRLVELYLLESFGGRKLSAEERQELRTVWRMIRSRLRRHQRSRTQPAVASVG